MARQSFVFDSDTGEMIDKELFHAKRETNSKFSTVVPFPYIRSDLPPYKSPVTGKMIEGRAARREDLARSGCREVEPSEYKPVYRNHEFCQKKGLPYMGGDVPPPMSKEERAESRWKRAQERKAEKAADALRAAAAEKRSDPDLAKFVRGNTKTAPIAKTNSVKDA